MRSALRVLCVCAPALCATAEAADRSQLWTWTLHAAGLAVEGRHAAAVVSLGRARKAHPLPELDAMVGLVGLMGGEPKLAASQLASAIRRGSTDPTVFYWAGRAELAARRPGAALKRLQEALAIGDRPHLHMGYGLVLLSLGRRQAAARSFLAVARREPNLLDPSLYPSPMEGVVDLLDRILKRFPHRLQLVRTQAHLLWRGSRVIAACRRFEGLLSELPSDPEALSMKARCQLALGFSQEALALSERAVKEARTPLALATRGEILLERKETKRAVLDLRKAADALPKDGRLLTRLAQACTEAEQPKCARRFFVYALRQNPKNAAAYFGLALHHQQAKEADKALAAIRRALDLDPGNPRYYEVAASFAHLQKQRGQARRWLGEARRARRRSKRFARLVRTSYRSAHLIRKLVKELGLKKGCTPECRRLLLKLPQVARRFVAIHLALGKGRHGAARVQMEKLLSRLSPRRLLLQDPLFLEQKGRTASGRPYLLRRVLPYLPPHTFRNTAKQSNKNE